MSNNASEFIFSKNEQKIRVYNYFSSSSSEKDNGENSRRLILTTERVILESSNKTGFSREEIPIEIIDKVDTSYYLSKKGLKGLFYLVLGLIFIAVGYFVGSKLDAIIKYTNIVLTSVGGLFFIIGIIILIVKKSKQSFTLAFYSTIQFYNIGSISGENFIKKQKKSKKKTKEPEEKQVKIISKITPEALVMLNEMSSLLIDIREFNEQIEYLKEAILEKTLTEEEFLEKQKVLLAKLKITRI